MAELRAETALVVGVGGIGTQIASRVKAFGIPVIGVDPKDIPFPRTRTFACPRTDWTNFSPGDVVFVAAPLAPQSTVTMFSATQSEKMKVGPISSRLRGVADTYGGAGEGARPERARR